MKKCKKCELIKPLSDFYRQTSTKDGRKTRCKKCIDVQSNEYRMKHKTAVDEKARENYLNNQDSVRLKNKAWRDDNREHVRKKNREAQRKWKLNPVNRLIHSLRSRLVDCIVKGTKSDSTKGLLGCDQEFFKAHIESQFQLGMTWLNYGEWHLDHIVPVAHFDMSDPKAQKECFNYKNLQPLWAEDNFKKSSSLTNVNPLLH